MLSTPRRRFVGILVLLGCLFGLMIWFGSLGPAPEVGSYANHEQLAADYDAWVGDRASLTGTVVDTDPLTITAGHGAEGHVELTVTETTIDTQRGERLAVYGIVDPDHTIRAVNAYTVPPANYVYMYTVSFLAGLWVLGRLVRTWRIDWETWSLVPRTTPLHLRDVTHSQSEEQDA